MFHYGPVYGTVFFETFKPGAEDVFRTGLVFFLSFASKTKKKIHLVWLNGVWSVYLVLTMTVINQQDWTKEQ